MNNCTINHYYFLKMGEKVCISCGINIKDVPKIVVAGSPVDLLGPGSLGFKLQKEREEGGFHWRDDIYFKRLENGDVRLKTTDTFNGIPFFKNVIIPSNEWASIISSMSINGEADGGWEKAKKFHNELDVK